MKFFRRHSLVLLLLSITLFGFAQTAASADSEPLPPDEAFKFKVFFKGPQTLIAELVPAKNHYLYKNKVRFAVKNASGVVIRQVQLPAGEAKQDQFFGTIEVFKTPVQAEITLDRTAKAKGFTLLATYQGCNEKLGLCYSPIEKSVDLVFPPLTDPQQ